MRQPCGVRLQGLMGKSQVLLLCSQARSGRAPGTRLLCPGRALPRRAYLLGLLPGKDQAPGNRGAAQAPFWPQYRSCLALRPRPPGHPGEGIGAGSFHAAKVSGPQISVRRKARAPGWLLPRLRGRTDAVSHGQPQAPRARGWGEQRHNRGWGLHWPPARARQTWVPSALLASIGVCRWFGPTPGCLSSRPQAQLRGTRP